MSTRIAINGFGRIGRTFLRALMLDPEARKYLNVVAINTGPCSYSNQDIFFKYDSLMGTFPGNVSYKNNTLTIDGHAIDIISKEFPKDIRWSDYDIDWVVDASGCFTSRSDAEKHCKAGARKVLITAPAHDEDITVVPGVNDQEYDKQKHTIISLGSCTTNCYAPMVKVIDDAFSITHAMMSTVHAYTNSQVLLDVERENPRYARAAALNIIPAKTGASSTITKLFPHLEGKVFASALRIPVPKVSLLELYFMTKAATTPDRLQSAFEKVSQTSMKGIIDIIDQPLVSTDFYNSSYSAIIDSSLTANMGPLYKVAAWYDNEYGYCCRLKDFLLHNS